MYFRGCLNRILLAARGGGEFSLVFRPAKMHSFCGREGVDSAFSKTCNMHSGSDGGGGGGGGDSLPKHTLFCRPKGDGAVRLRDRPKRTFAWCVFENSKTHFALRPERRGQCVFEAFQKAFCLRLGGLGSAFSGQCAFDPCQNAGCLRPGGRRSALSNVVDIFQNALSLQSGAFQDALCPRLGGRRQRVFEVFPNAFCRWEGVPVAKSLLRCNRCPCPMRSCSVGGKDCRCAFSRPAKTHYFPAHYVLDGS